MLCVKDKSGFRSIARLSMTKYLILIWQQGERRVLLTFDLRVVAATVAECESVDMTSWIHCSFSAYLEPFDHKATVPPSQRKMTSSHSRHRVSTLFWCRRYQYFQYIGVPGTLHKFLSTNSLFPCDFIYRTELRNRRVSSWLRRAESSRGKPPLVISVRAK